MQRTFQSMDMHLAWQRSAMSLRALGRRQYYSTSKLHSLSGTTWVLFQNLWPK